MTDLMREADFEKEFLDSTQLVNRQPHSNNLELWYVLLEFQSLRFGLRGVSQTWRFMKDRAGRVDEFFYGPTSDKIWPLLISGGLESDSFLQTLCRHEMKMGAKRPSFLVDIVGSLLSNNLHNAASQFSRLLQPSHPVTEDDAYQLFMQTCDSPDERALWNFRFVSQTFERVRLYSRVVPYLCSQERLQEAWAMHKFCLSRGDLPPNFDSIKPLFKYVISTDGAFEELLHDLQDHNISYDAQASQLYEQEKSLQYGIASGSLNIVTSRTMGVQPSRFSDNFVARALATTAFSLNFILQGLRLLGLREIGPLGLRQIALSVAGSGELCRRLEKLKELDIDCGSSTYARVVTDLAIQGKDTLLADVLASDQHPDVFEDVDLQEKLLVQYYRDLDWRQMARTLAILRVSNQEFGHYRHHSEEEASLNLLLRSVTRAGDWPSVPGILARISTRSCLLSLRTLRCMHNTILSSREPGKRLKVDKSFDDVGFLINIFQGVENAGTHIPPTFWREPISRLGILGRWNDLERLLFWLAARYSREATPFKHHSSAYRTVVVNNAEDSLSKIFSLPLQRALIRWAFLYRRPRRTLFQAPLRLNINDQRSGKVDVPFTRGIRVLRMLQDQYGVPINVTNVRYACLEQLRIRFAPDHFLGRPVWYNTHRKYDRAQLPTLLKLVNQAWSGVLFFRRSTAVLNRILRPRQVMRQPRQRLDRVKMPRKGLNQMEPSRHGDRKYQNLSEGHPELPPSQVPLNFNVDPMKDVVMYRDIYNTSLEDYDKPDPGETNNRSTSN